MKIPKEFKLLSRTWTVEFHSQDKLKLDDLDDALGACHSTDCTIRLAKHLKDKGKEDLLRHTFLHELCHAYMYSMGYLHEDGPHTEQFVDLLANLMAQYEQTKK